MKKLFTLLGFIGCTIVYSQNTTLPTSGISSTENYIYSRTYLAPTTTSSTSVKQIQSVTYFDGLGRPKQSIAIKGSATGKDLVTPIPYDGFGRQVDSWLPTPMNTLSGGIQSGVESAAVGFYNNEPNPFSHNVLENSPLDRIQQQIQPGSVWSNKPVAFSYDTNTATEVKKFKTTTTWLNNATSSAWSQSTNYGASQLYKNTVTDEDGNKTEEFKNGEGQTILLRKNDGTNNIDTYYVYNEYNQLVFVIPPLAAAKASLLQTDLDHLCYQYRYDGRNRLVEKKLPGKGWEYMLYDKQDRLVSMQDALMKTTNQWMFTKYDQFGRVVYTGLYTSSSSRAVLQLSIDNNTTNPQNNESRTTTSTANSGFALYYTNTAFPVITTSNKLLSVNYYDSYPTGTPAYDNILGQSPLPALLTGKGLATASFINNIETNAWTSNYTFYDLKARPFATYSFNYLGGYTKTESLLDFAGIPQKTFTFHKRLATTTEVKIQETFTYNPYNHALVKHDHKVNNNASEILTENSYNEIGQLINKKVGNNLQNIDYTYNIRGWLTGINEPANLGTKLFGYKIKYNNPANASVALARYNGNISEVDWSTSVDAVVRRYSYNYDRLNRLLGATYQKPNTTTPITNAYNENLTFDLNGNIKSLSRFGGVDYLPVQKIDQLSYTYTGNKLTKIIDTSYNPSGYPTLATHNTIGYDSNGNMTTLLDKGISLIKYNYLNLPSLITQNSGNMIYTYRADGTKIKKVYGVKTTDYLDGFQYENAIPQFVPTAEGYYEFTTSRYVYNYKDHLGNIRLSYYRNGAIAQVLEENNYYPFGLKHEGYNELNTGTAAYNYKYNSKELQETGIYAMDFRHYMPDVGRFTGMDRLTEFAPGINPYRFGFNNPISFSDPTGLFETRKEAREYRQERGISGSVNRNKDGSYAINDKSNGVSYTKGAEASQEIFTNDGVQESVLLAGKKSESSYIETAGKANAIAGFGVTGIEQIPGSFRLGTTVRGFSPKYYDNGWGGNQFATTTKFSKLGKGLGRAGFGIGLALDTYGVVEYANNPNSPNVVHPAKVVINTGMGAWGLWGGPPGAIAAAVYTVIDVFYPGGWVGASETAARTEANEQTMTGHPFLNNSALKQ